MTPIITAFVGAVVVLAGALVARNATRYAAELDAAQRRRDAELTHLREFRDVLIDALTYASVYRYALGRVAPETADDDRFDEAALRVDEHPQLLETFVVTLAAHHRELLQSYPVTPSMRADTW